MNSRFSLRTACAPDSTTPTRDVIESWLRTWGTSYLHLRDMHWRAYDPVRDEQFRFRLDFVLVPAAGRQPSDYLLLDIQPDRLPNAAAQRSAARCRLLMTLWPGCLLTLRSELIHIDPTAAQLTLLNAL